MAIRGLHELSRSLREAQEALGNLDGHLTEVRFDPDDPASIEGAIQEVERAVDERVGRQAGNAIVAPLAERVKQHFRQTILDRAAATRGTGSEE